MKHLSDDRPARLAGTWYPADPQEIAGYLSDAAEEKDAVGALCPHAGWTYSGKVAGAVYSRLPRADTFVLLGANHYGRGWPLSVYPSGAWQTPAGVLPVDADFAAQLLEACPLLKADAAAHTLEHSLEVQTPFIAHRFPGTKIVPILLHDYSLSACRALAEALQKTVRNGKNRVILIASSDMSHVGEDYGQRPPKGMTAPAFALAQDEKALDRLRALDDQGLLDAVTKNSISMCGAGPAAVMAAASRLLGAQKAETVMYRTSSDITKDTQSCVAYAGVLATA
ncbi:MAG TPA: AmmeMemoRadiSam system protein B [Elusimicrobiota bacterium]|nr:AmmeMemoRadiSam system protein B [Elusimicrobiota bacterium]